MLDSSSKNTITNIKLIEAYSSFFEKLFYASAECDQNLSKLAHLKKNLLQNVQSRTKLEQSLNGLLEPKPQAKLDKKSSDASSSTSSSSTPAKPTETNPQNPQSPVQDIPVFQPSPIKRARTVSVTEDHQDSSPSARSSWSQLEEASKLVNQIKSSTHLEGQKITSLINSFTFFRNFNQQESMLSALCLSFFEKHIYKLSQTPSSLSDFLASKLGKKDSDIDTLAQYLDIQLKTFIKSIENNSHDEIEIRKKFYENLASNSSLYNSCILIFKKIVVILLEKQNLDTLSKKTSFQWMNELAETDKGFYEELAVFFEANLHFYFLSSIKFVEQTFDFIDKWSYQESKKSSTQNVYVLLDRTTNHSYILYQPKDAYDSLASYLSPVNQKRVKQRSYTPLPYHRENSILGEFSDIESYKKTSNLPAPDKKQDFFKMSPRSAGKVKKSSHETGQNPLIQISDLLNNTLQPSTALPYFQGKAGEYTHSPEKGYGFDKSYNVIGSLETTHSHSSPTQKPKEYDYSPNNHTLSREKETNTHNISYQQSPSSLVDRIMDEINQKIKAEKGEKHYSNVTHISPSHYSVKEGISGKGYHHRAYSDMNKVPSPQINFYQGKEQGSTLTSTDKHFSSFAADISVLPSISEKQPALPISLKAKFNHCNKTIDQHNFEFSQATLPHVSKDVWKVPSSSLNPYYSMIKRKTKGEPFIPSIGSKLQKDSKY